MQRVGTESDLRRRRRALDRYRRRSGFAYLDAVQEQGAMPEPANREQRRMQQKLQQGGRPSGGAKKKRR